MLNGKQIMRKKNRTLFTLLLALLFVMTQVTGCGKTPAGETTGNTAGEMVGAAAGETTGAEAGVSGEGPAGVPALPGLDYVSSMETYYAEAFHIHTYWRKEGDGELCHEDAAERDVPVYRLGLPQHHNETALYRRCNGQNL